MFYRTFTLPLGFWIEEVIGMAEIFPARVFYVLLIVLLAACSGKDQPLSSSPGTNTGTTIPPQRGDDRFGADANPTGDPIGGSQGYTHLITTNDYLVSTRSELLAALDQAVSGQTVYVADSVAIDLTGLKEIPIASGVTLAGGRGKPGTEGGHIFTTELNTIPLFLVTGPDVRITGLRIQGPDTLRRTEQMQQLLAEDRYYSLPNSRGIQTVHPRLQVDNCELWGWSHAAIFLQEGSTDNHIHHNFIHHNQRHGLGYGVVLDRSNALIEANRFDWCRHHIAGTGRTGTSYEARYNLVLENANSHSFDMHGGRDRGDGTNIAGDLILIHHNTFQATDVSAVVIRGIPNESAEIYNNWFLHNTPTESIRQTNATGNLKHYKNQYTQNQTIKD